MIKTVEGAPPTTAQAIEAFEKRRGLHLPESLRDFLLARNGGRPERDLFAVPGCVGSPVGRVHLFFGLGDPEKSCDLDWNFDVFADRIPQGLLPVATTEGADKLFVDLRKPDGPVLFWDAYATEDPRVFTVARNFTEFLDQLTSDEVSPGRARN